MNIADAQNPRTLLVVVVYLSLFLDNVLLTVVVPVIPDYLCSIDNNLTFQDENGRVGLLLSSRAFVQLVLNPVVGSFIGAKGYSKPLFFGNLCLLLAAVLFALGQSYAVLFLARSIQGVSSACIGVSGMTLVASQYPEEDKRSKVMGFVLGSIAMGVLLGYPIGSVLYDLEGKIAPFLLICFLSVLLLSDNLISTILLKVLTATMKIENILQQETSFQIFFVDFQSISPKTENESNWMHLLDSRILIMTGAICCSTLPMAILEPCLPIWLKSHLNPKKWQLGTVFIPDSFGYLIGTNFFGLIAYYYGRCKTAVLSMIVIGISAILIPMSNTMTQLVIPHFGLGIGIGVADAALVPLLATMVEQENSYGPLYSLQQVAVSLAYSLGPIIGGELVRTIGFQWVMRIVGLLNLAYCLLLIYLQIMKKSLLESESKNYNTLNNKTIKYDKFVNSEDEF